MEGVNGFLVPARDSTTLAASIKLLLQDVDLQEKFSKASRQLAVEHFSREIVNDQTCALYRQVLNS